MPPRRLDIVKDSQYTDKIVAVGLDREGNEEVVATTENTEGGLARIERAIGKISAEVHGRFTNFRITTGTWSKPITLDELEDRTPDEKSS